MPIRETRGWPGRAWAGVQCMCRTRSSRLGHRVKIIAGPREGRPSSPGPAGIGGGAVGTGTGPGPGPPSIVSPSTPAIVAVAVGGGGGGGGSG